MNKKNEKIVGRMWHKNGEQDVGQIGMENYSWKGSLRFFMCLKNDFLPFTSLVLQVQYAKSSKKDRAYAKTPCIIYSI